MADTKLNVYEVTVNGYRTKIQLTEEEARKRKLIPDTEPTPSTKTTRKTGGK